MKYCAIILIVIILGLATWLWKGEQAKMPENSTTSPSSRKRDGAGLSEARMTVESGDQGSPTVKDVADPSANDRRRDLERLKAAWLEIGPGDHDLERRDALQEDSIISLMCSLEMYELSVFLEERAIRVGTSGGSLEDLCERIFQTPEAGMARSRLVECLNSGIPNHVLNDWLEAAGRHCEAEDFDEFYTRLETVSPLAASSAMFGKSLLHAKTNPNEAIADFLGSIDAVREDPYNLHSVRLSNLLEFHSLPPGTDFEGLAEVLEAHDPGGKRFPSARETFFTSWGRFDPAAAANHIMAKPEIYPPELVTAAASQATGDLASALQWVQMFPDGPYRDAAAEGCADLLDLSDPGGARRFLPLIRDAEVKARVLEKIEGVEKLKASGEPY